MIRSLFAAMLVAASAGHCFAALPFTCKASGDNWSIAGTSDHKVSCSLRCLLRDAAGNQDSVACSPVVSAGPKTDPVCEGFLIGKHWTEATLVAGECATLEP